MSNKKNIDRLFQEKFRDFEANPANDFWNNIEAKLDEKKRKRVIPFWWKFSGVAAVFLIGILIGNQVLNDDIAPSNPIVVEDNSNQNKGKATDGILEKDGVNGISPKLKTNTAEAVSENSGTTKNITPKSDNTSDDVIVDKTSNEQKSSGKLILSPMVNDSKATIAHGKSNKNSSSKNKLNLGKNKTSVNETLNKEEVQLVVNKEKNNQSINNIRAKSELNETNPLVQTDKNDNNQSNTTNPLLINKDLNLDGLKGDNNSKIATKEIENKINDTTTNKSIAKNELEELLNKKEEKLKQESKLNRWQLTSNVAPIFLGSTSNGSPIDSTLINNSKSYNTGVGYGIGVSYAVSKKLTVRTGLNKFNMSYNTNDIVYFAGMESRSLKNINPTASGSMIQVQDDLINSPTGVTSETSFLPFEESFVQKNKGYINQEMGYLEMPVEMTYALLDKKFGIKIIGGFSTLFLQDNSVSVISDNRSTFLGEANNLNNIHFSTNFGIGLKYGFMKSFEFNIEPTFKYQLNTFSSDAGNFKPYLFGIYSGISYKF
ncbi:outer membrane beta-barrel protein [Flavobacterium sp. 102]|uniref:outer membrane beta-barrel protein n=1 Tax=Flavobacterium sp. 102 TaxID=2135623 RepID=UPI000EB0ACD7|nr:outer membrane beta-barrel protein [Flavobacterium sp. 102]RKS01137.1 hypothetical protein C8C84_0779 [Flavobacterium sp. 102]